jgi:hypothetical protein
MSNVTASILMKNGKGITVNFTDEAMQTVLAQFADFDPLSKNAGTQTIRVYNNGKMLAVIRCDEIAAITT